MPWRNLPPDWVHKMLVAVRESEFAQGVLTFLAAFFTASIGAMAKIADEVKSGDRKKFFSAQLWLDIPTMLMTAFVTISISAYYDLPGPVAAGVSVLLGYAGPRVIDAWLLHRLRK